MALTPHNLIPTAPRTELAVGTVIATGRDTLTVELRPGMPVRLDGAGYSPGELVVVALPGGQVSGAQIVSRASGKRARVRQVVV